MIARVSNLKFKGSELEDLHLSKKIEFVIDDMVAVIPGMVR
jgi:hypothetical protein